MSTKRTIIVVLVIAAATVAVVTLPGCSKSNKAGTQYQCPMHPEVTLDKPGKCPKCGMDLVPTGQTASLASTGEAANTEGHSTPRCSGCGRPVANPPT